MSTATQMDFAQPNPTAAPAQTHGADLDRKGTGTWAHGAGASGPKDPASRSASLSERASIATSTLSDEARGKLAAADRKDAERLAKVIMAEGKSEDKHLKANMKELEGLQKAQLRAAKEEEKAGSGVSKAARNEQKAASAFLNAKAKHEAAQAHLKNAEETLESKREHAEQRTKILQKQAEEVDILRERKSVDDREREGKLETLRAAIKA